MRWITMMMAVAVLAACEISPTHFTEPEGLDPGVETQTAADYNRCYKAVQPKLTVAGIDDDSGSSGSDVTIDGRAFKTKLVTINLVRNRPTENGGLTGLNCSIAKTRVRVWLSGVGWRKTGRMQDVRNGQPATLRVDVPDGGWKAMIQHKATDGPWGVVLKEDINVAVGTITPPSAPQGLSLSPGGAGTIRWTCSGQLWTDAFCIRYEYFYGGKAAPARTARSEARPTRKLFPER